MGDSRRCIAYTPRVPSPLERTEPSSPDSGQGRIRRRRLPGPREQARRKAWGEKWGAALKAAGKQLRDERG